MDNTYVEEYTSQSLEFVWQPILITTPEGRIPRKKGLVIAPGSNEQIEIYNMGLSKKELNKCFDAALHQFYGKSLKDVLKG